MSEEINGDTVRYTVKELLAEIREGIAAIRAVSAQHELRLQRVEMQVAEHGMLLGSAAPQIAQLAQIIETQAEVKEALTRNEDAASSQRDSVLSKREKLIGLCFGAVSIGLGVLSNGPDIIHAWFR